MSYALEVGMLLLGSHYIVVPAMALLSIGFVGLIRAEFWHAAAIGQRSSGPAGSPRPLMQSHTGCFISEPLLC
jgi:hypothetical protein